MRAVVYVVAKAPLVGQVKTRLCPPLTPAEAAQLAAAFLRDSIDVVRRASLDARLICRRDSDRAAFEALVPGLQTDAQSGEGLGAALETAFTLGLGDGYDRIAVLGADSPTLPPEVLVEALRALDDADVALGPSDDGGYYLLAARHLYPTLFRDMVWSTSDVAAETLRRCAALALRTQVVATWPDVDDAPALRRLVADLAIATPDAAPHTRAVLRALALDSSLDLSLASTRTPPKSEAMMQGARSTTFIQETATR